MTDVPKKLSLPQLMHPERPLVMVTAYDHAQARHAQGAGVDLILVGDSLGNVVLGYESTAQVTLGDMLHHARAVRRGAPQTFMVVDLPFGTYQLGAEEALRAAVGLVQEAGADAVKLEGASANELDVVRRLVAAGIPVMGHVGLLPQTATAQGGLRVQGKDEGSARLALDGALALEQAGAFSVVLEAIPAALAALITGRIQIPTIGIGAGPECDGQVLVYHDVLGVNEGPVMKMVRRYAEVGRQSREGLSAFAAEVRAREFPGPANSFSVDDEVLQKLY
ncbi:3-methyl-2-oxobutanoate hydroxymethyltransferase [Deinococcus radiophilus]|uniref:3-methyl-2-oxobutanoate hydroxymethyltransferase n=1 Tax=Deinococcus radiophilus TaxID=32062 RepID=A0A3S0L8Z6_9DEIO|nr:3-methyl-2-oxobutanoate hydroxymethyltransferase [Deinococcus radiophilus]RTR29837.1 3-methyl-2-oxobutanoate hydroxymethyltransferase [Deinococcus radiophilus]UFA49814.1 3-methyl-2-oxobutanoate hydroxymethyltransferase [Deinococcus radiophilus]